LAYKTSGAFIFRTSKKIIVLNQRVKDFLLANGVPEAKIVLAVNGVDLSLFYPVSTEQKIKLRQKYDLPVDKTLALFVGRFVPKKGFNKLIKAASENYTLVFVGGERPANVRPNKYMIFLGTFSQRETADVYQACDVFILPSQGEGFPLSIQEAMACGLPIITTDDHGYVTYSFDRSLLCLIHPSVDEIKKHLTKVVKDSKLREAMGEYSYDYAKEHFNWSRTTRAMSNVYSESLN
jgi:D-inositol-3-phosphate glycosyltransferase